MNGPLQGIKVIEMAHLMAGPVAGLMLADMGADVIKVERPSGDDTRHSAPYINGEAASYMMMNRSKRGIVMDLKDPAEVARLRTMIAQSDVLLENFRPGTLAKLGLGYDSLKDENPGLIYGAISGFGRTGPYADRAGFDLIAQGMSGIMSVTGEGPGCPPCKVGPPVSDITAGTLLAMGVCAALEHRNRTGEGQIVETSLMEAAITHTYWQSGIAFATGEDPAPMGSAHPLNAPYQALRTADGYINIGAANQGNWERLVSLIGRPDLGEDPRFATNDARMANRLALEDVLNAIFSQQPSAHWLALLEAGGFPAGPVLSIREMHADPQTIARDMVPEVTHPVAGVVQTLGLPVKFSRTPGGVTGPAPTLGQHRDEILADFGLNEGEPHG
ncbi:MAG: CoA transferase [Pseudomonadota bacterium]